MNTSGLFTTANDVPGGGVFTVGNEVYIKALDGIAHPPSAGNVYVTNGNGGALTSMFGGTACVYFPNARVLPN